jgi:hypothetical protein
MNIKMAKAQKRNGIVFIFRFTGSLVVKFQRNRRNPDFSPFYPTIFAEQRLGLMSRLQLYALI